MQRTGADAQGAGQNGPLGIRASVSLHSHTRIRGGKSSIFGKEMPTTTDTTTECVVLLEVFSADGGEVLCVGEGTGVFHGPAAALSDGANSAGDGTAAPFSSVPPEGNAQQAPGDGMTEVNGQGGADASGSGAAPPFTPIRPTSRATGAGSFSGAGGSGAGGAFSPSAKEAQAALRTAAQNAVFDLPRRLLAQSMRAGSVKIIGMDGDIVVLNAGSRQGWAIGREFEAQRSTRKVVDADSGEEFAVGFRKVAVLRITRIEADYCEAKVVGGGTLRAAEEEETERVLPCSDAGASALAPGGKNAAARTAGPAKKPGAAKTGTGKSARRIAQNPAR